MGPSSGLIERVKVLKFNTKKKLYIYYTYLLLFRFYLKSIVKILKLNFQPNLKIHLKKNECKSIENIHIFGFLEKNFIFDCF